MRNLIKVREVEGVAVLSLQSPPQNSLDQTLRTELQATLDLIIARKDIKGLILEGTQGIFANAPDLRDDTPLTALPSLGDINKQIENAPFPTVAVINGRAIGAGASLALACHYRVGEAQMRFGFPEIRLGLLVTGGASQRLPRVIGAQIAAELFLTGHLLDAKLALQYDLIEGVAQKGQGCEMALRLVQERKNPRPVMALPVRQPEQAAQHLKAMRAVLPKAEGMHKVHHAALDVVEASLSGGSAQALALEERLAHSIRSSEVAQALRLSAISAHKVASRGPQGQVRSGAIALVGKQEDPELKLFEKRLLRVGYDVIWVNDQIVQTPQEQIALMLVGRSATAPKELTAPILHLFQGKGEVWLAAQHKALCELRYPQATGITDDLRGQITALIRRQKGLPIWASDATPPLAPLLLAAYWQAADHMVARGCAIEEVDQALEAYGFALGPFAQRDAMGLKKLPAVAQPQISSALLPDSHTVLRSMWSAGRDGRAAGQGFYDYNTQSSSQMERFKPVVSDAVTNILNAMRPHAPHLAEEIVEYCLTALQNASARLIGGNGVDRGIDAALLDQVALEALGFPRWRGGPLVAADQEGPGQVLAKIWRLCAADPQFWEAAPAFEAAVSQMCDLYDLSQ